MDSFSPKEINLLDYWGVLVRRRWVVFTAIVVLVVTVTLGSFLIPPTYQAICTLQIEREQPNVLTFQQVQPVGYDYMSYNDFYQTQYKLLASRNVAHKAAQKLDLRNDPVVNRMVGRRGGRECSPGCPTSCGPRPSMTFPRIPTSRTSSSCWAAWRSIP